MRTGLFFAIMYSGLLAMAHGEDKPGPHGGYIKMPANFHTEVIADKDGSFHIYLLDLQFQNPTVIRSEIQAHIISGKIKSNLSCKPMGTTHFHCTGTKPDIKGELILRAKRQGTWASMKAKYALPLKGFPVNTNNGNVEDHSKHH